jgi:hypothetical protein
MPSFDIAKLETSTRSEEGVEMEVIHPRTQAPVLNDDGSPVTITLLGRNSEAYLEEERAMRDRRQSRLTRGIKLTQEDLDDDEARLLCAATKAWTFATMGGQDFPCTPQNARRLWSDRRFRWLRERAIQFVLMDGNFLVT